MILIRGLFASQHLIVGWLVPNSDGIFRSGVINLSLLVSISPFPAFPLVRFPWLRGRFLLASIFTNLFNQFNRNSSFERGFSTFERTRLALYWAGILLIESPYNEDLSATMPDIIRDHSPDIICTHNVVMDMADFPSDLSVIQEYSDSDSASLR